MPHEAPWSILCNCAPHAPQEVAVVELLQWNAECPKRPTVTQMGENYGGVVLQCEAGKRLVLT